MELNPPDKLIVEHSPSPTYFSSNANNLDQPTDLNISEFSNGISGDGLLENGFNFENFFDVDGSKKQFGDDLLKVPVFNDQELVVEDLSLTDQQLSHVNTTNTLVSPSVHPLNQNNEGANRWPYFGVNQPGNTTSMFGDSTTLGSESRTSNEFVDNFESINENEVTNYRAKFTNSITNSFSNMFRSNNSTSTNKFNLRVINPLSTHRDPDSLVQQLPSELVENVENLSIVRQREQEQKRKKKRSTTSNIVNALTNKKLGFNSNKSNPEKDKFLQGSFFDDLDNESLIDDSVHLRLSEDRPNDLEFDEQLSRVISLASKNNSTYNFNSDLHSLNISVNQSVNRMNHEEDLNSIKIEPPIESMVHITPDSLEDIDYINPDISQAEEECEDEGRADEQSKNEKSPDYAALFSEINPIRKKSKTLSFRKMTLNPQSKQPTIQIEEPSDEDTGPAAIIPLKDSTRGRKPSLEFDPSKTFVCTYCSRRFKRQEHLKRHFRSLHTNQKPFDCHLCGKKFSRSDNLTQHIKTHYAEESS